MLGAKLREGEIIGVSLERCTDCNCICVRSSIWKRKS